MIRLRPGSLFGAGQQLQQRWRGGISTRSGVPAPEPTTLAAQAHPATLNPNPQPYLKHAMMRPKLAARFRGDRLSAMKERATVTELTADRKICSVEGGAWHGLGLGCWLARYARGVWGEAAQRVCDEVAHRQQNNLAVGRRAAWWTMRAAWTPEALATRTPSILGCSTPKGGAHGRQHATHLDYVVPQQRQARGEVQQHDGEGDAGAGLHGR